MFYRQLFSDVAVAVLLAMPMLAFARPQASETAAIARADPIVEQAALVERTTPERRSTLPG